MVIFRTKTLKRNKKPTSKNNKKYSSFGLRNKSKKQNAVKTQQVNKLSEVDVKLVEECINTNHLLSFKYTDRNNNSSQRTVEPYQILNKSGTLCLYAVCLESGQIRMFYLSKAENFEKEDLEFKPRFLKHNK